MNADRRLTLARPDIADDSLRGIVPAERYVAPRTAHVSAYVTGLRAAPRADCSLDTEAIMGEEAAVLDADAEGWAFVQLRRDGYVGYLPAEALSFAWPTPTHEVVVLRSLAFPAPELRMPVVGHLVQNARVTVVDAVERRGLVYAVLADGTSTVMKHLAPIGSSAAPDYVAVAEAYLGTPYQWGGRTSFGIDCSGLVQTSLARAGLAVPRDSDLQQVTVGADIGWTGDIDALVRGDLVFWKGHVAIVQGPNRLLHASGHAMATVIEPADACVARNLAAGNAVTAVKRLG